MTGAIELAIIEALEAAASWPARITAILVTTLDSIAGVKPIAERVSNLAIGDRQFLLSRLGSVLSEHPFWQSCDCLACGQRLTVAFRYPDLPVKSAGISYPFVEVQTSSRAAPVQFRVPTGEDQDAILPETEGFSMRRELVSRLTIGESAETISEEDLDKIELAIETVAPEVGLRGVTACPECKAPCEVEFDLYTFLRRRQPSRLFEEVDQLAHHYHWSESQILTLPIERRRMYLGLIDRRRGMHSRSSQTF